MVLPTLDGGHGGWKCAVGCNKRHSSKQNSFKCKCKECPECHKYVHNIKQHNKAEHGRWKNQEQTERRRIIQQKRRENATEEERAAELHANKKYKQSKRTSDKTREKKYPCPRCGTKYVYSIDHILCNTITKTIVYGTVMNEIWIS